MTTPIDLYRERLASGQIDPDPLQEKAAGELTRLQAEVIAYERDRESWRQKSPSSEDVNCRPEGFICMVRLGVESRCSWIFFMTRFRLALKKDGFTFISS